jgi:hypothetical protein
MWRVKNPPAAVADNPSKNPDSRNPGDDLLYSKSVSVSLGVSIKYIYSHSYIW